MRGYKKAYFFSLNQSLKTPFIALLCGAVIGCSSEGPATGTDAGSNFDTVAFNDSGETSPLNSIGERIVTAVNVEDSSNSWFCTFTLEGEYVDRRQILFWSDGNGLIDGVQSNWEELSESISVTTDRESTLFYGFEFSTRVFTDDLFTAMTDSGYSVSCDWSGPPRNELPLDDAGSLPQTGSSDDDDLNILLLSGENSSGEQPFWSCSLSGGSEPATSFDVKFFDDSSYIAAGQAGQWLVDGKNQITLGVPIEQIWSNLSFTDGDDQPDDVLHGTIGVDILRCDWAGPQRVDLRRVR